MDGRLLFDVLVPNLFPGAVLIKLLVAWKQVVNHANRHNFRVLYGRLGLGRVVDRPAGVADDEFMLVMFGRKADGSATSIRR